MEIVEATKRSTISETNADNETNTNVSSDESEEQSPTNEDNADQIVYHIYRLQRTFQNGCKNMFTDFFSQKYRKTVLREINRIPGVNLSNFSNYQIIERLFRKELPKLPNYCHKLVIDAYKYILRCLL